ncbi:MAG: 4-oxalocrotonate tautomerase family protein [Actinomycetota bacterium]|nr:4-oxalocrotonate tautomerase family protein [Actinomycetota bacterium]
MPIVEVSLFSGRTPEQKLRAARAISDALVDFADAAPETVHVIYRDVQHDDWLQADDLPAVPHDGS